MDRPRIAVPERARPLVEFGWRFYRRVVEIDGIDRAIAIGALSFTALFPLLIVWTALLSRGDGERIADRLVDRFDLSGSSADSIHSAFLAPIGSSTATVVGAVLVALTALSFTRGMQRMYETAWRLERRGMKGSGWGLLWLAELLAWLFLQPALDDALRPGVNAAVSLALACVLWLTTPYLLLGRRIHYRKLLPSAALSTVAMTVAGLVSVVVMPRIVASSSEQFGTIGIAFALLTWLTALAMVTMGVAVLGAELDTSRSRAGAPPRARP